MCTTCCMSGPNTQDGQEQALPLKQQGRRKQTCQVVAVGQNAPGVLETSAATPTGMSITAMQHVHVKLCTCKHKFKVLQFPQHQTMAVQPMMACLYRNEQLSSSRASEDRYIQQLAGVDRTGASCTASTAPPITCRGWQD